MLRSASRSSGSKENLAAEDADDDGAAEWEDWGEEWEAELEPASRKGKAKAKPAAKKVAADKASPKSKPKTKGANKKTKVAERDAEVPIAKKAKTGAKAKAKPSDKFDSWIVAKDSGIRLDEELMGRFMYFAHKHEVDDESGEFSKEVKYNIRSDTQHASCTLTIYWKRPSASLKMKCKSLKDIFYQGLGTEDENISFQHRMLITIWAAHEMVSKPKNLASSFSTPPIF